MRRWTWAHRLCAALFLLALVLGRGEWFPWVKGALGSTRLFDVVPFADPLAALEVVLASRHASGTLVAGAGLVLLVSALLGRVFCAWLCPLGLVLELNASVRAALARFLRRRGSVLPTFTVPGGVKYWLLALFLLLSLVSSLPVFTTVSPINVIVWACVFGLGPEALAVVLLAAVELFSPRLFCRSLCPLGALYSLVGRWGFLRVWIHPETAGQLHCRQCSMTCPIAIPVMESHVLAENGSVGDPECTRCGICVDHCRGEVLTLGFRRGSHRDDGPSEKDLSRDVIGEPPPA